MSVFGVILVQKFLHSEWILRDMEYLSVFSSNLGQCFFEFYTLLHAYLSKTTAEKWSKYWRQWMPFSVLTAFEVSAMFVAEKNKIWRKRSVLYGILSNIYHRRFLKIVYSSTIFAKNSILDVLQSPEFVSAE